MNEKLYNEWIDLKKQEDALKAKREKLSVKIAENYKHEQGSKTFHDGKFDIEVKNNVYVKVDQEKVEKLLSDIALNVLPFRIVYELDKKKYDATKEISPKLYRQCADAVTFTPGKVGVKVLLGKGK